MSSTIDRRAFVRRALAALVLLSARPARAASPKAVASSNFRTIYRDPELRDRFFLFLQNVFHLYPEDRFHQLIIDLTARYETDEEVYVRLLADLPAIKPRLSDLTYALPALRRQKAEMARQTLEALGTTASVDGYLEIGSTGRYVGELGRHVKIDGPIYLTNDVAPSYAIGDTLERGQVSKIGTFVPLGNYDPILAAAIPDTSLDLVTNFIGFHHCPGDRLEGFVHSIRRTLRPGGRLLLRDHDVDGREMEALVGLAHDVFNAGLFLPWDVNRDQVRRFRTVDAWSAYLVARGFRRTPRPPRAQRHDPTRNLLVEFVKT